MRVTNNQIFEVAKQQTAATREKLVEWQQKVATGVRVTHPGDDPAAAGLIVSHRIAIGRLDTIDTSVARATDESQMADTALVGVSTLLAQARSLAVQLGNDTYSASDRAGAAQEIAGISAQIVQAMNTQVAGRYIFGGNVDRSSPFDASGNYLGDTAVRQIEVAPGLLQNASVRADVALKGAGGGVDVFAVLSSLATALNNNDSAGIRGSLTGLDGATDQIADAITQNGTILSGFESARSIGGAAKDAATKDLSSASEVDMFDAASQLAKAQQALEASLAVTSRSFTFSLLDFMNNSS